MLCHILKHDIRENSDHSRYFNDWFVCPYTCILCTCITQHNQWCTIDLWYLRVDLVVLHVVEKFHQREHALVLVQFILFYLLLSHQIRGHLLHINCIMLVQITLQSTCYAQVFLPEVQVTWTPLFEVPPK